MPAGQRRETASCTLHANPRAVDGRVRSSARNVTPRRLGHRGQVPRRSHARFPRSAWAGYNRRMDVYGKFTRTYVRKSLGVRTRRISTAPTVAGVQNFGAANRPFHFYGYAA
ncbi:hypothetical protein MRX96_029266 [Rhipicephalus microplus]